MMLRFSENIDTVSKQCTFFSRQHVFPSTNKQLETLTTRSQTSQSLARTKVGEAMCDKHV